MISVEGLKVEFNATPLFEDVSYVINKKDRIALVGKNGAGKSTMLKILAGIQQPTAGIVAVPRECTIGTGFRTHLRNAGGHRTHEPATCRTYRLRQRGLPETD